MRYPRLAQADEAQGQPQLGIESAAKICLRVCDVSLEELTRCGILLRGSTSRLPAEMSQSLKHNRILWLSPQVRTTMAEKVEDTKLFGISQMRMRAPLARGQVRHVQ
jgi:hypothetical protein